MVSGEQRGGCVSEIGVYICPTPSDLLFLGDLLGREWGKKRTERKKVLDVPRALPTLPLCTSSQLPSLMEPRRREID